MERTYLWACVVAGLLAFLCRFGAAGRAASPETDPTSDRDGTHGTGRMVALFVPFVLLLLTLPKSGAVWHEGGQLGFSALIGGLGAILAALPFGKRNDAPLHWATLGVASATIALTNLFLRASLFDALFGVAAGWFCTTFALYISLPVTVRTGNEGGRLAAGAGMVAALAGASLLGELRDELTPERANGTWTALLCAFAGVGALFGAGASVAPLSVSARAKQWVPYWVATLGSGLALFLLASRTVEDKRIALAGAGGLLLWPLVHATFTRNGSPSLPTVAVLTLATGFLGALQLLQGTGVAAFVVGLWVAFATLGNEPTGTNDNHDNTERASFINASSVSLVLFSTILLLWRVFSARFADDLRGVTLTDQYALLGLLLGGALPSLLANVGMPNGKATGAKPAAVYAALLAGAVFVLASPGATILLFGPKCAVALLIGLALGVAYPLANRRASMLPSLFATRAPEAVLFLSRTLALAERVFRSS